MPTGRNTPMVRLGHSPQAAGSAAGRWAMSLVARNLADQARGRLLLVSVAVTGLGFIGFAANVFFVGVLGWPVAGDPTLTRGVFLGLVAVSAVFGLAFSSRRVEGELLLNTGLFYEVVVGFGLAMLHFYGMNEARGVVSWLTVWLVLFPLVVPVSPARAFAASTATASMSGLALALGVFVGEPVPAPNVAIPPLMGTVVSVAVGFFPATVIFELGRRVAEQSRELQLLGSYQLVGRLDEGGMGEVWRAEHRLLARPAAIKFVRRSKLPSGNDVESAQLRGEVLARFEREARATAALTSIHTVQVFDYGVTEHGDFYYVMELLEGIDLYRFVKRYGALHPARAIYLMAQICESLHEAHEAGMIHRDVKPGNVIVSRLGLDCDVAKVMDFGLVTQIHRGDDLGQGAGTPWYMPPEQVRGERDLDRRADVYSLGVLMFWMLTARLPFEGDTVERVMDAHLQDTPPPPSARARQPLPPELDALVIRCMAKEPDQRPTTALHMADLLRGMAAAEQWSQSKARAWWASELPRPG